MNRDLAFRRLLHLLPILLAAAVLLADACAPSRAESGGEADPAAQAMQPALAARRVGTPGISLASLVLALGGRERLAAVAPEVRDNPWLRRIAPGTAQLPVPFRRPAGVDMEALLAARLDLAVLWGDGGILERRLAQAGVPVVHVAYADAAELLAAIDTLGQALGGDAQGRAEALGRGYRHNLQRVSAGLAGLPAGARPRIYYASISPLLTEGRRTMVDAWIGAAGGLNVAAAVTGDAHVQLEDVLRWNPEIIVTQTRAVRRQILDDPRWRQVAAVRNHRVLVNPGGVNAWCTRAAEASLQVLWAAKMFHPERFPDVDVAAEARRFYHRFYDYDLNDQELARLLRAEPPEGPEFQEKDAP